MWSVPVFIRSFDWAQRHFRSKAPLLSAEQCKPAVGLFETRFYSYVIKHIWVKTHAFLIIKIFFQKKGPNFTIQQNLGFALIPVMNAQTNPGLVGSNTKKLTIPETPEAFRWSTQAICPPFLLSLEWNTAVNWAPLRLNEGSCPGSQRLPSIPSLMTDKIVSKIIMGHERVRQESHFCLSGKKNISKNSFLKIP